MQPDPETHDENANDDQRQKRARDLQVIVLASREIGATGETLAALTDVAALLIEGSKTTEAANLLAYILHHPDIPYDTYDRADDLWLTLESELCPRVISDAREQASYLTLRGAVEAAFGALE